MDNVSLLHVHVNKLVLVLTGTVTCLIQKLKLVFCHSNTKQFGVKIYCEIIIVCRRPIFLAFISKPCSRIYMHILTNVYASIYVKYFFYKKNEITSQRTKKILTTEYFQFITNITMFFVLKYI